MKIFGERRLSTSQKYERAATYAAANDLPAPDWYEGTGNPVSHNKANGSVAFSSIVEELRKEYKPELAVDSIPTDLPIDTLGADCGSDVDAQSDAESGPIKPYTRQRQFGGNILKRTIDRVRTIKFGRKAIAALVLAGAAAGVASGNAPAAAADLKPGVTTVAQGAWNTHLPQAGKVIARKDLPLNDTKRLVDTTSAEIVNYPGNIIAFPVQVGPIIGPGGLAASDETLRQSVVASMEKTGSVEADANSLGTTGIFNGVKDVALKNPNKKYTVVLDVSPLAPGGIADELGGDEVTALVNPALKMLGISFNNDKSNIPKNMNVTFITRDGDIFSDGLIDRDTPNGPGQFDLRQTIVGTAAHYEQAQTGKTVTRKVTMKNGTVVTVAERQVDKNQAGKVVANVINGQLVNARNMPLPPEIKNLIPKTVGKEVFVPDITIPMPGTSLPTIDSLVQSFAKHVAPAVVPAPGVKNTKLNVTPQPMPQPRIAVPRITPTPAPANVNLAPPAPTYVDPNLNTAVRTTQNVVNQAPISQPTRNQVNNVVTNTANSFNQLQTRVNNDINNAKTQLNNVGKQFGLPPIR